MMKKGFTLIELLVVIAIIGILAAVILVSLNSARAKARDARRISDIKEMQKALELYYNDNGHYPVVVGKSSGWDNNCGSTWQDLSALLAPYMSSMPFDPTNSWTLCYYYRNGDAIGGCPGTGHGYTILFSTQATTFNFPTFSDQTSTAPIKARYCVNN